MAEPESELSSIDQRLRSEQVLLLCKASRPAMVGGVLAALFVAYLLSQEHSLVKVAIWLALMFAITFERTRYQLGIAASDIAIDRGVVNRLMFYIGMHGAIWSLPGTWLLLSKPESQVVLALFLVGISANALISLTPVRHAYSAFIGAMMLPMAVQYFRIGNQFATSAIGIVVYLLVMAAGGNRQYKSTEELLRLQLDNAALAERLQRDNTVVERANRDLEAQIEQRERTEAELRVAKGEAEAANRAKNQFLANMSHELRTPLNGVLGTSELLIKTLPTSESFSKPHKYAETIRNSGERLLHLINDILDMARIEAGAIRFDNAKFDPRRLIADIVESVAEQCAAKNLKLHVEIDRNVPHEACGDIFRLRQVLGNLIANATKFTEHGGVDIKLELMELREEELKRRALLRWSVTDTGLGIEPKSRAYLFQPFSQLDDSSTRRFGGTGLGLAICKQIVTALGGRIDVDSNPGTGSTFWFEVPLELPDHEASVNTVATLAASRALGGNVLVVEDNEVNGLLIVEMLELVGCKTQIAQNGKDGLELLLQQRFDLVVMDWHMPEMDGIATTRAWREFEANRRNVARLPIVALTASVLPGDRDACLDAGMDDFLAKPFTYDELIDVVARWLPKPTN